MRAWKATLGILAAVAVLGLNALVLSRLLDLPALPRPPVRPEDARDDRPVVRVGVISRYAPALTYERYQPVMDYLSRNGSYRYELRLSATYEDAAEQLRRGDVVASFFGTWIYARLGPRLGLEPILAPRNEEGGTTFHAALLVPSGSPISSVADLAGRRVALPSRSSFAGNWLAVEALPAAGLSLADLDSVHHFDYHQTVVHRVLDGEFDAGVVREAVAHEFEGQGIRVIARSGPFPGAPVVVRAGNPHPAIAEMERLLLALDPGRPADRGRMRDWAREFAQGFVAVDARTYDAVVRAQRGRAAP
jgi:phosphonate transport system substrate-binding protein